MIMRCNVSSKITAGKIVVMSVETFTVVREIVNSKILALHTIIRYSLNVHWSYLLLQVLKTSLSYFTFLRSM